MNFENPDNSIESKQAANPAADFERIYTKGGTLREKMEGLPEAEAFYNEILDLIDTNLYPVVAGNQQDVLNAIRLAAKDNGWTDYDSVNMDKLREEFNRFGIPLKARKKSADYQ